MGELKWWQKTVVYQIYPKSFCDSNGDGIGDIPGIISKLDYLQDLGVGAIWLCPIYPSPLVDNGYDISDYCSVAKEYGTMEDMERLISEADKRNIKIVMDLVFNHTSDKHKWFEESRSSKDNPKRDWYIWRDGKEDGSAPTNWRSIFGGSAWTLDEKTNQYYLHTFASAQPDLNWENKEVRQALFDAANFWLDKGVRGFRLDAIVYIKKPSEFKDLPVDGADNLASIAKATTYQDGILDFLHEFREKVFDRADIFTVAEADGVYPSDFDKWIGENGAFDMSFDFSHIRLGFDEDCTWHKRKSWNLIDIRKCFTEDEEATKDNGWVPVYFENHDLPRCTNYFFPQGTDIKLAAKFIATILLTMRGTPFIYQGEEIGMENFERESIDEFDDIGSHGQYQRALEEGFTKEEAMHFLNLRSRDNTRTPMQWDNSKYAGFSDHEPWLKMTGSQDKINVESQFNDPNSIYSFYKKMISIRKQEDILVYGDFEEVNTVDDVIGYKRTYQGQEIICLCNFTNTEQSIPDIQGNILLDNYNNYKPTTLKPYQFIMIKK